MMTPEELLEDMRTRGFELEARAEGKLGIKAVQKGARPNAADFDRLKIHKAEILELLREQPATSAPAPEPPRQPTQASAAPEDVSVGLFAKLWALVSRDEDAMRTLVKMAEQREQQATNLELQAASALEQLNETGALDGLLNTGSLWLPVPPPGTTAQQTMIPADSEQQGSFQKITKPLPGTKRKK